MRPLKTLVLLLFLLPSLSFANDIKTQFNNIDATLKKSGHKGINKQFGIGRFLYFAMNGKTSLEEGLDYAFWTELSEKDRSVDDKWKLSQVIDDYEIYKITEFKGGEVISLTIAIPAQPKMAMEGQKLKDGLYLFTGNVDFVSISGVPILIQGFQPVNLNFK